MAHLHCINFIDREKLLVINILLKMSSVSKPIFSNIIDKGKRIISDAAFDDELKGHLFCSLKYNFIMKVYNRKL